MSRSIPSRAVRALPLLAALACVACGPGSRTRDATGADFNSATQDADAMNAAQLQSTDLVPGTGPK